MGPLKVGSGTQTRIPVFKISYSVGGESRGSAVTRHDRASPLLINAKFHLPSCNFFRYFRRKNSWLEVQTKMCVFDAIFSKPSQPEDSEHFRELRVPMMDRVSQVLAICCTLGRQTAWSTVMIRYCVLVTIIGCHIIH